MKIIFIRHGDPDYEHDSLTEKGVREALLLSERTANWPVTQFYCSPLGRAQKTASYTLARVGREAITHDWMKEFFYPVEDPVTGRVGVPWDFMPEYWTEIPQMYDREGWKETELYRSNPKLLPAYAEVCEGIDNILASYGYRRHHNYYLHENLSTQKGAEQPAAAQSGTPAHADNTTNTTGQTDSTIVIFCHLGVICVMMSHLLGISPALLFHSLYLAPTSVTILGTEERRGNIAQFRAQVIGDTSHLSRGGEPVSAAGYFTDVFQG